MHYQDNIASCLEDLQARQALGEDLDAYTESMFAATTLRTLPGKALLSAVKKAWDKEREGATIEQRARRIAQAKEITSQGK